MISWLLTLLGRASWVSESLTCDDNVLGCISLLSHHTISTDRAGSSELSANRLVHISSQGAPPGLGELNGISETEF